MSVLRQLLIFFTIGETNPRYWLAFIGALVAFVAPAMVFSANEISPPLIVRIPYSLLIMALAGSYAAPADNYIRLRIASSVTVLPFLFALGWFAELWQVVALFAASLAAFGAGLAFGSRDRSAYLSGEFESD